jgi:radical SAM superfamily enzyme YgiQ (UPF0313 family)
MSKRVLFYCQGEETPAVSALSSYLKNEGHETGLLFDPGLDQVFFVSQKITDRITPQAALVEQAIRFEPDLVAFSLPTISWKHGIRLAENLKEIIGKPQVVGGAHITSCGPTILSTDSPFDYAVIGEGEHALLQLVQNLENGTEKNPVANLWQKTRPETMPDSRPLIENLDDLPFGDKEIFFERGAFSNRMCIMTSRGCPYRCAYCIHSVLGKKSGGRPAVRVRSVENVIDELQLCRRFPYNSVRFWDDLFGIKRSWVMEFCERYKRKIKMPFSATMHPLHIDADVAHALAGAGCTRIAMGVQSGSQRVRKQILGRSETEQRLLDAAKAVRKAGISLLVEVMFAVPTETDSEMDETVDLVIRMKPKNASAFIFFPFAGTELANRAKQMELVSKNQLDRITNGELDFATWHAPSVLQHPYKEHAFRMKVLLPVLVKSAGRFAGFRKVKNALAIRLLHKFSLVFIDQAEFVQKLRDYFRIVRVYRRRFFGAAR